MAPVATNAAALPPLSKFGVNLTEHLRAGYQIMYVQTTEEHRAEGEIAAVAARNDYAVLSWDGFEGFTPKPLGMSDQTVKECRSALGALDYVANDTSPLKDKQVLFVFRDLDDLMAEPLVRRRLKTFFEDARLVREKFHHPIIILSSRMLIHEKVKSAVAVLDFDLPGPEQLSNTVTYLFQSSADRKGRSRQLVAPSQELHDSVVNCLLGLGGTEAENCLARCIIRHGGFVPEMLATIKEEKAAIIKKGEVLTYIPEEATSTRSEIGGFENLLEYLDRRKLSYTREAQALKLDYPRGIVLVGVPGTGKSMIAKATSRLMGLPGYIFDVSAIFASHVGESEAKMRDTLKQIEAQRGCVLLVDEADKAFGGASDASSGDSGVTKRVFGKFLNWLAEKNDKTFVIMTMNRTAGIPPELLRAGRFDAVFYTDLPTAEERRAILEIHFRKRNVDPAALGWQDAEWAEVITKTDTFVGSELEEVVRESRAIAFQARRVGVPSLAEVLVAASGIVPLARTDAKGIDEIREWCKDSAKPVGRLKVATRNRGARGRGLDL